MRRNKKSPAPQDKRATATNFVVVWLLVLGLAVSITCAVLLSNALSLGHLIGRTQRLSINSTAYYSVQMASVTDKATAEGIAKDTALRGGAGYLYNDNGLYRIIASVYKDESDAQQVVSALNLSGYNASVYKLTVRGLLIDIDCNDKQEEAIKTALTTYTKVCSQLYILSTELDEGKTTCEAAKIRVMKIATEVAVVKSNLEEVCQPIMSRMELIRIKAELNATINSLGTIELEDNTVIKLSGAAKYRMLSVLDGAVKLNAELFVI